MFHRVLIWVIGAIALGIASLVINALLVILKIGNLKTIVFVAKVRRLVKGIPDEMLLSCTNSKVSALAYDSRTRQEKVVPLYTGVLTWGDGGRLAGRLKRQARRQFYLRSTIFLLVFAPLVAASLWFTLFVDWKGIAIPATLVFHQFVPFYIWDSPALSGLLNDG